MTKYVWGVGLRGEINRGIVGRLRGETKERRQELQIVNGRKSTRQHIGVSELINEKYVLRDSCRFILKIF